MTAKPVTARFDTGELEQLDRVAARYRLGRSAALRAGIDALDAAGDGRRVALPEPPSPQEAETTRLVMALRRIGINVNQVVRHIHMNKGGEASDAELLLELVDELTAAVVEVAG